MFYSLNLYYIPDPPFLLHAILETALTHLRIVKCEMSRLQRGPQGNEITYLYSVVSLNFVAVNFRGVAENEMFAYFLWYRFSASS